MILYRPIGLQELEMVYDSGMKAFPARLPQQPIFYPVLQLEYARQVAADWNAKNGQLAGYVTEFKVEDEYIGQFEEHTVGESQHEEYWIPAEEVEEFNRHITGHIKVLEAHFGDAFQGFVPKKFGLQGKNAVEQFTLLANSYLYKRMDFYLEIKRNHKAIFLNYPFWQTYDFKNPGLKEKILQAIKEAWLTSFPKIPLPLPVPEEIRLAKQTESDALTDDFDEEIAPVEETESYSLEKPLYQEPPRVRRIESDPLIDPVHEDTAPVEQTDSYSRMNSVLEDDTFVEQTDSSSLIDPVSEDTPGVKETASRFSVDPAHEDISHEPADSPLVQGIQFGLSGKYHEAIAELSKAVEEDPDHVVARTSLGVAFHRLGEDHRALACYEAALRIDPIYAEAHYFRANILYSQGNVREAIAGYTIAIGLKPELIEAHQKPAPQDRLTDYSPAPAEMYWIAKPAHRILVLSESLEAHPRQANLFKERAAEHYRLLGTEHMLLVEEQGIFAGEDLRAGAAPYPVATGITERGRKVQKSTKRVNIERALR
jgi:tetratricopeptide (TPR) repeat protein